MLSIRQFSVRYRYSVILLKELVRTDFKLRYQGSVLGYLWSLLRPLAIFFILYVVFIRFLKFDYGVPHSAIYLLIGTVFWNLFTDVTSSGLGSVVGKGDLLRKINFPKYVVVLAASLNALINLVLNFAVVLIFMLVDGVAITVSVLWVVPLVIELFVFALAIAFILSAAYVKLRDMNHIWDVVLQAVFYATPIFYPLTMVPLVAAKIMLLNPIAQIIQDLRWALVTHDSPTIVTYWGTGWMRLVPIGIVAVTIVFSIYYFRKNSSNFAEEV